MHDRLRDADQPRNFARSFDRLCGKAGLGHWKPNQLHHSAISLLSAAGMRAEDIADVVGHVTTRMTTRVYRHQVTRTIETGKMTMETLFRQFGGQLGGQAPGTDTRRARLQYAATP